MQRSCRPTKTITKTPTRKERRLRRQCGMSIGCDEENFSSPEECCLQPLRFIFPKE